MSIQNILAEAIRVMGEPKFTVERAQQHVRDTCFVKPKVPDAKFLEVCRKYDPNFAPVSSAKERAARAEISKKAQEGLLECIPRELRALHPDLKLPRGIVIDRHQSILFRGRGLEEQQRLADIVTAGNKKALGDYVYERLNSKKDEIFALLEMDDAQLVENYFKCKDEIDLIFDMEPFRKDCEFTEEQQKLFSDLHDRQMEISYMIGRMDMMANPYYANYYCENLEMSHEDSQQFRMELAGLAREYGETIAGFDGLRLGGPTYELTDDFTGVRGFAWTTLQESLTNLLQPFGATKSVDCVWAGANGKMGQFALVSDSLNDHELIFADIPGKGIKALHNTQKGFRNCKPEVATPEVVHQYILGAAEKAVERSDAANPFFISVFTGSNQYEKMNAQYKAVKEMLRNQTANPSPEDFVNITTAIGDLQKYANEYLQYKKEQGLQEEDGNLVGRSANERKRLASAREALDLVDKLSFVSTYQQDPAAASGILQSQQKEKEAKVARVLKKAKVQVAVEQVPDYAPEELGTSTEAEMQAKIQPYKNIASCPASDAGNAMVKLHSNVRASLEQLARLPVSNAKLKESHARNFRELMAQVVLFDYVLRERTGNEQPQRDGTVVAGAMEQALNRNIITPTALARSPEFIEAIGKVTPARVEAFLKNGESRNRKFDSVVEKLVSPVKVNVAGNQAIQKQPTAAMKQPEPPVKGGP